MSNKLGLRSVLTIVFLSVFLLLNFNSVFSAVGDAAEDAVADLPSKVVKSLENNFAGKNVVAIKEEVKKIEEKTEETKEILKEKEEVVEEAKKEAEEIIKEKEAIVKEVQSKEAAAELIKEKGEALKKEAEITKDRAVLKKAKALAVEAKKLEQEVDVHKDKLKKTESKVELAQEKVGAYQASIEALRKELEDLKKERVAKRSPSERAVLVVIIVVAGIILFLFLKLLYKGFERLVTKKDALYEDDVTLRIKTTGRLFNWLGGFIISGVVVYMVLEVLGFSLGPLIAGAGIVGLAFGFGGQYLIRDLINGLFILLEGQYNIGDVVKIGEYGGLVEDINLRITTLRDLEGRVIIVPNGEIKTVVNYTREYGQALLAIGVAYKENVDHVMEVLKGIGADMRKDNYFGRLILGDIEMFGVDDFSDSQVTIKFRMKTLPIKQWEVAREFRRRIKNRFDELGIEIPFPHQTVYWGTGKENEWVKDLASHLLPQNKSLP